ncbi:hypothetical protein DFH09DRAFT_1074671 [Mycena vulgaris]|nr:hypothetical protein DFH09DRAFT_1074671 [Mycena vulgaris]
MLSRPVHPNPIPQTPVIPTTKPHSAQIRQQVRQLNDRTPLLANGEGKALRIELSDGKDVQAAWERANSKWGGRTANEVGWLLGMPSELREILATNVACSELRTRIDTLSISIVYQLGIVLVGVEHRLMDMRLQEIHALTQAREQSANGGEQGKAERDGWKAKARPGHRISRDAGQDPNYILHRIRWPTVARVRQLDCVDGAGAGEGLRQGYGVVEVCEQRDSSPQAGGSGAGNLLQRACGGVQGADSRGGRRRSAARSLQSRISAARRAHLACASERRWQGQNRRPVYVADTSPAQSAGGVQREVDPRFLAEQPGDGEPAEGQRGHDAAGDVAVHEAWPKIRRRRRAGARGNIHEMSSSKLPINVLGGLSNSGELYRRWMARGMSEKKSGWHMAEKRQHTKMSARGRRNSQEKELLRSKGAGL